MIQTQSTVQARGRKHTASHELTTTSCNNSMGLKCLLATVGITFILAIPPVVAEPATLSFADCFSGEAAHKVQVSTVYGQQLSNRYLNFTIIGNTPIEIVSASNNTAEPVASACHLNSFNEPGCDFADLLDCFPSHSFHDHRPTHVQRMGQWILLLCYTPPPVSASHPSNERRKRILSANAWTFRVFDSFEASSGLRTCDIQHPPARFGPLSK